MRFEDGEALTVDTGWLPGQRLGLFTVAGEVIAAKVDLAGAAIRLRWRGIDVVARVRSPRVAELALLMPEKLPADTSKLLLCPMPGIITGISVGEGDEVEAGQALATVEAMKMENILRAEKRGRVSKVSAKPGDSLAVDEVILEFE
jgi:propionyl-CoA carboxylase alpha chain